MNSIQLQNSEEVDFLLLLHLSFPISLRQPRYWLITLCEVNTDVVCALNRHTFLSGKVFVCEHRVPLKYVLTS